MTLLQIESIHSLTGEFHNKYRGIAADGMHLYCTVPSCKEIHQFDPCFMVHTVFTVCRPYSSICYDILDHCFWALSPDSDSSIYQLDCDLQEISCFTLLFPGNSCTQLTGIAYDWSADELTVTTAHFLAKFCKEKKQARIIQRESNPCTCYRCVEMAHTDYLLAACTNDQPELFLTTSPGETVFKCFLACKYTPLDMAIPYICKERHCLSLYILVHDTCNCCHILQCMISICEQDCRITLTQSCTDLIESVALIEASLAHILNAEGEKLQKILSVSDDFCEIMKVNESINQTIKNATRLERLLVEKLRIANRICPPDKKCKCRSKS